MCSKEARAPSYEEWDVCMNIKAELDWSLIGLSALLSAAWRSSSSTSVRIQVSMIGYFLEEADPCWDWPGVTTSRSHTASSRERCEVSSEPVRGLLSADEPLARTLA